MQPNASITSLLLPVGVDLLPDLSFDDNESVSCSVGESVRVLPQCGESMWETHSSDASAVVTSDSVPTMSIKI